MSDETNVSGYDTLSQPMGSRLRVVREQAGLSQAELATRVGVETASIAAWERDERQPRANRLVMLCGVLDVSLKWLFEGREDAHMGHEDDSLDAVRAELERLRGSLEDAAELAASLAERVEALDKR